MCSRFFLSLAIWFLWSGIVSADGNINVTATRGNLRITGGKAAGQLLKITQSADLNSYILETNGSTTFNGSGTTLTVSGITGNTDIRLSALDSAIILTDGAFETIEFSGNLNITTTSRTSSIVLLDSVYCDHNVSVSTGSGNDAIVLGRFESKENLTIRTGSGEDTVFAEESSPQVDFLIDGGTGGDIVMLDDLHGPYYSHQVILRGASGDDLFGVRGSIELTPLTQFEIDGGLGTDQYLATLVPALTTRRIDSPYPRTFDNMYSTALDRGPFGIATFTWALLHLDD